jgi:hypothetical protein
VQRVAKDEIAAELPLLLVQRVAKDEIAAELPLLLVVRPAWALSIGCESRMVKAVVAISSRQGCPPRGGI